jgi:anti-sigma regulatory factor (Ser/Thr protein kinase)
MARARAREIFDRSRVLFDRSRVVAAHLLDPPRHPPVPAIEAAPSAWVVAARNESLVAVCAGIGLRDLNLIDTLLSELELMERREEDSTRLSQLYRLDHLATRLRRNAENLRVLAGRDAGESSDDTTSILDTVRAAMSSIDQYARVSVGKMVSLGVVGFAANDLSRVFAELLDNAANHSPPTAQVRVSAHLTEQGSVLVRIEDGGIGLPPDRIDELNGRVSRALPLDDDAGWHMGLAVVGKLAERHGLRVSLHRRLPTGTTAGVLVPPALVTELPEEGWLGTQTVPVNGRRQRFAVSGSRDVAPVYEVNHAADGPADHTAAARGANDTIDTIDTASTTTAASPSPPRSGRPSPRRSAEPPALPTQARPQPVLGPATPTISGITASGLPRRMARSIKDEPDIDTPSVVGSSGASGVGPPPPERDATDPDGHEKFLADLGDFADGEQTAHADDASKGVAGRDGDATR